MKPFYDKEIETFSMRLSTLTFKELFLSIWRNEVAKVLHQNKHSME